MWNFVLFKHLHKFIYLFIYLIGLALHATLQNISLILRRSALWWKRIGQYPGKTHDYTQAVERMPLASSLTYGRRNKNLVLIEEKWLEIGFDQYRGKSRSMADQGWSHTYDIRTGTPRFGNERKCNSWLASTSIRVPRGPLTRLN